MQSISLRYNSLNVGTATAAQVMLRPAVGGYVLIVAIQFARNPRLEHRDHFRIDRLIATVSIVAQGAGPLLLDAVNLETPETIELGRYNGESTLNFSCRLSAFELESIERLRVGGDFSLELKIDAMLSGYQAQVSRSGDDDSKLFRQGVEKLNHAGARFHEGDYSHCVGKCRDALELLKLAFAEPLDQPRSDAKSIEKRERTIRQRLGSLRTAALEIASVAHHEGEILVGGDRLERREAQLMLTVTAALLAQAKNSL